MKILYHHRTRSKDGQNVHIEELTGALRERGHEVIVVGPVATETQDFGADAGLVATLKRWAPKRVYELLELAYAWPAYRRLERAYLKHRPDCLYERYNLFLPSGVWLKRRFGLPMLSEVNAPLADERSTFDGLACKRLARWSEHLVWRGADYVLPVTNVLAEHARAAGVPESRIVVIPNGINRERFAYVPGRDRAKERFGLEGRLVLGFTGFIREWHGLERVVDFIARANLLQPAHFLVVGEGPAKKTIEQRARALGVADRVTFAGLVGRDQIVDYVAAFDVALQPDVVAYASPLKVFEYMALGCAVVAPNTENIREVLTDGQDGVLFERDRDDAFAAALARVCDDPALRARVGAGAQRTIERRGFTWANNAHRVETLVAGLLGSQRHEPVRAVESLR